MSCACRRVLRSTTSMAWAVGLGVEAAARQHATSSPASPSAACAARGRARPGTRPWRGSPPPPPAGPPAPAAAARRAWRPPARRSEMSRSTHTMPPGRPVARPGRSRSSCHALSPASRSTRPRAHPAGRCPDPSRRRPRMTSSTSRASRPTRLPPCPASRASTALWRRIRPLRSTRQTPSGIVSTVSCHWRAAEPAATSAEPARASERTVASSTSGGDRIDQVAVRAGLQSPCVIGRIPVGAAEMQHLHAGQRGIGLESAAHLVAVDHGQRDVEHARRAAGRRPPAPGPPPRRRPRAPRSPRGAGAWRARTGRARSRRRRARGPREPLTRCSPRARSSAAARRRRHRARATPSAAR